MDNTPGNSRQIDEGWCTENAANMVPTSVIMMDVVVKWLSKECMTRHLVRELFSENSPANWNMYSEEMLNILDRIDEKTKHCLYIHDLQNRTKELEQAVVDVLNSLTKDELNCLCLVHRDALSSRHVLS